MTQPDARLLIIVPTRSRPENVAKVVRAWEDTDAFRHADLLFAYDLDDPKAGLYDLTFAALRPHGARVKNIGWPLWRALVPKLNDTACFAAEAKRTYFAIGFAGDDHLPRTHGWAARYLEALLEMGTGVVSCPDGYRTDDLPTQWAMTADIVRALGRMVPAPVEHLYCDDAVRDLAKAAGCWRYLPDVLIEHMHPLAGKTEYDDQYKRVNSRRQFAEDKAAYEAWKLGTPITNAWLERDAETVRALITAPNATGAERG